MRAVEVTIGLEQVDMLLGDIRECCRRAAIQVEDDTTLGKFLAVLDEHRGRGFGGEKKSVFW